MKILLAGSIFLSLITASCDKLIFGPEAEQPLPIAHQSKLASILDSMRYKNNLPALAGAIVTDTGIIDAQAVGCRRYGGAFNITNKDQFHLGSCTKSFTAVLIGSLIDEGVFTWDTKLPEIFPDLAGSMRSEYKDVTIRNILSHSAGLVRDPDFELKTNTLQEQRREIVTWALMQPPVNPRGQYLYSNMGYMIAAAIVESANKGTYEKLLFDRVLIPLGITTAGFGPMGTVGLEDQPLQHTINYSPVLPYPTSDLNPIYHSAGLLHMSIGDWALYIKWVINAANGHQTLLHQETANNLFAKTVYIGDGSYYALGWGVYNASWAGSYCLQHSGSNGLNYCIAEVSPGRKAGIIIAANICAENTPYDLAKGKDRLINFYLSGR